MTYLASAAKMCGRPVFFFGMVMKPKLGIKRRVLFEDLEEHHPDPVVYHRFYISKRQLLGIRHISIVGQTHMGAGGSPKIIGIYGQILEMGHGSTTVHFWTVNYRSMWAAEWPKQIEFRIFLLFKWFCALCVYVTYGSNDIQ